MVINCANCNGLILRGRPCPKCRTNPPYRKTLEPAPGLSLFIGLPLAILLGIGFLLVCFIGLQLISLLIT
jgi:hypothetical protein